MKKNEKEEKTTFLVLWDTLWNKYLGRYQWARPLKRGITIGIFSGVLFALNQFLLQYQNNQLIMFAIPMLASAIEKAYRVYLKEIE